MTKGIVTLRFGHSCFVLHSSFVFAISCAPPRAAPNGAYWIRVAVTICMSRLRRSGAWQVRRSQKMVMPSQNRKPSAKTGWD